VCAFLKVLFIFIVDLCSEYTRATTFENMCHTFSKVPVLSSVTLYSKYTRATAFENVRRRIHVPLWWSRASTTEVKETYYRSKRDPL
jgi:hypothetical protein